MIQTNLLAVLACCRVVYALLSVQFPPNQSFAGEKSIQEIWSGDLLVRPHLQSFSLRNTPARKLHFRQ